MHSLIVADDPTGFPNDLTLEIVSAEDYLVDARFAAGGESIRVLNLCRSFGAGRAGRFVTTVAEARGHKPIPSIAAIHDLGRRAMIRTASADMAQLMEARLPSDSSKPVVLRAFLGYGDDGEQDELCAALYASFRVPLMAACFISRAGRWYLSDVEPIDPDTLTAEERRLIVELGGLAPSSSTTPRRRTSWRFDLAILHDPDEANPPSDERAMECFIRAADDVGFRTELVRRGDYRRLPQFDALFIRETTRIHHHTYRFARRAQAAGVALIDEPQSILRCTNKLYLSQLLDRHHIPRPSTMILTRGSLENVRDAIGFPCVLKPPDGARGWGMIRALPAERFEAAALALLEDSEVLIAQRFIATTFVWRIGVLERQPLYACRYYPPPGQWHALRRNAKSKAVATGHDAIDVAEVPPKVLRAALRAANLIGNGLYGVDVKETRDGVYVVEVNDNPTIDGGVEDQVLGAELYERVMRALMAQVEARVYK